MPATWLLYAIFFCSGASALIFETLWFRQAGLLLGNSVWASSMVLSSFMAGLAIGNAVAGKYGRQVVNPVRAYGRLEVLIGLTGVSLVLIFPQLNAWLTPVLRPYLDEPWVLNPIRLGVGFGLMLIPTAAMGATLPLMVQGLTAQGTHFGERLGRLYACNTLGAMTGALGCEIVLIPALGLRDTGFAAAACSVTAGVFAMLVSRWRVGNCGLQNADCGFQAHIPQSAFRNPQSLRLLAATFLCGGALLALEVVWFRYLVLFNFGTTRIFAVMLAIVLGGIAIGGLIAARFVKVQDAARLIPFIALASALLTLLTYALPAARIAFLPVEIHNDYTGLSTLWRALPVMLPVSVLSGMLFTLIGQALHREGEPESATAGALTLANTIGAMCGALLGGFVLLPQLGMDASFLALAVTYAVVAFLCRDSIRTFSEETQRRFAMGFVALVALAGVLALSGLSDKVFLKVASNYTSRDTKVVAIKEGLIDTMMYTEAKFKDKPLYHRLITNTHSMSATTPGCWQYMKMYVYLPVAVHPAPRKACLISYGCGVTAKALTDTKELSQIDVVDISQDILDLNRVVFPDPATRPLSDPRVHVHIEDGRFYLQTTDERYDLITSEPPPPKGAGIVNLYTREYFQLIHDRLARGGMVTYWLPYHSLTQADGRAIMRAFYDVFEDSSLWMGSGDNWMLFGIREGHQSVDEERFRRQWLDTDVAPMLAACGFESPEQFGSYFIADAKDLRELLNDTLPLVDNYPQRLSPVTRVEYKAPQYVELLQPGPSRERFQRSEHVQRLWPASLIEPTLAYFDQRTYVHDLWCYPKNIFGEVPVRSLAGIHRVQSTSPLRSPVMWSLRSSYQMEQIADELAETAKDDTQVSLVLGHKALADREFAEAAERYEPNLEKLPKGSTNYQNTLLRCAYALCMDERVSDAQSLIDRWLPNVDLHESQRNDWKYLKDTFGLTESRDTAAEEKALR